MLRGKKLVEMALQTTDNSDVLPNNEQLNTEGSSVLAINEVAVNNDIVMSINNGTDLIRFKETQKYRNMSHVDLSDSLSEPFSPEVSEYRPSDDEGSSDTDTSLAEDQERICVNEPNTSKQKTSLQRQENKKLRQMPKKTNTGRKRKRNPENWKDNVRKRQKNLGLEFVNKQGKVRGGRILKPPCPETCKKQCSKIIRPNVREQIFKDFWGMGSHNQQIQFISRSVERVHKNRVIASKIATSRRQWTYKYAFYIDSKKQYVCKTMFLGTLDISEKWVSTIYKKIDSAGECTVLDDQRGRHNNKANKIPEEVKNTVRSHIALIPHVDSHYVRARSEKKYFEETLTFAKLYRLYEEWLSENYPIELKATQRQYREIFYNEYNIDFFKPKKDQCSTCDVYKRATPEEKEVNAIDNAIHVASKFVVRELKTMHTLMAKNDPSITVACYDLQKILQTPMSEVSSFYYKRKLAVYNFTIFDICNSAGYCYMWNETIGKKGANEISSSLNQFISLKVTEGTKEFIFYSDSCGGQNRNRIVFFMYSYIARKYNIDIIHIFYEVGHSQNEGDSMHALIERRKKKQIIYVPDQWVTLVRCAKSTGKPYRVTELDQEHIMDFKQLMKTQVNLKLGTDKKNIQWSKIKFLKVTKDNPTVLHVGYNFLSEDVHSIDLDKKPITSRRQTAMTKEKNIDLQRAYNGPLPITVAKYKDLISLCTSKVIPDMYHPFFTSLKTSEAAKESFDSDED